MGCAIEIWGLSVITSFAQHSLAKRLSAFHEEVFLDFAYTTTHMRVHTHTHTRTAPLWFSLIAFFTLPSSSLSQSVVTYFNLYMFTHRLCEPFLGTAHVGRSLGWGEIGGEVTGVGR